MFSPPAKRARAAPEELVEKASGGTDTGDGTEVNVGATLKQLQADFSKFRAESADAKLANESKVRELEGRLAGADKDPRAVTMPPPRMPPPPGMGAGKSDLATEIAELKAQMAELKGSPPPRPNAEPGSLRDILAGLLDEDGEGLPDKADNEKKGDKEAMRRKLCTSVPYQLSELKKDRLGMRPEEAATIPQLWDALRYRLDQEAEFHTDTHETMAELTKVLRTAQEQAVQELAIISGPLRHHGAEQKAQVESLFVAKVHRRLRSEPSLAGAPILTLVSDAARECESMVQSKAKVAPAKNTADAAVEEAEQRLSQYRGGYKHGGRGRGFGKYGKGQELRDCFQCGMRGHIAANCPSLWQGSAPWNNQPGWSGTGQHAPGPFAPPGPPGPPAFPWPGQPGAGRGGGKGKGYPF
jgi:hypothetical protein